MLGQNNIQLLLVEVEKGKESHPLPKKKIEIFLQFSPSNNILQKLLAYRLIYTNNSNSITLNAGSETRNHGLNNMTKSESHVAYMDNISL